MPCQAHRPGTRCETTPTMAPRSQTTASTRPPGRWSPPSLQPQPHPESQAVASLRQGKRAAEPSRQNKSRGNHFNRVGQRYACREFERIAVKDIGKRVRRKARKKVRQPHPSGSRRHHRKQHSICKPDRRHALRLPREINPEPRKQQQNEKRANQMYPRNRLRTHSGASGQRPLQWVPVIWSVRIHRTRLDMLDDATYCTRLS